MLTRTLYIYLNLSEDFLISVCCWWILLGMFQLCLPGASLLQEHENLLENFKHFLHPSVKAPLQQDASSRINSSEVHFSQDGRSCTLCMTQSEQIEKREATISCHANQCLIADHDCSPNLDKALMKAGKGQREHVEKKILKKGCKRTVHLSDDEYLEHYNKKRINLTKKQKFAQSINDSVSEKLHQECLWEEGCFASQRVNERECSDMHYTFCCKSYTDHNVPLSTEERSVKAERLQNLSSQIITIVILTIPVTAIFRRSVLYLR